MISVQRTSLPVSYEKCDQTVTVYHWDDDHVRRTVFKNAFYDLKTTQTVGKNGEGGQNTFLLVIPCSKKSVFKGDKVLLGEGPEIVTREEWAALIPAKVDGLSVVRYVDCKYWRGKMCHLEAGG
ncbi:MAG: hypothetical protein IKM48_03160 [Clostridia bacterium]|nr:hypothetical protein [Clostridia bacterium]